MSVFFSASVKQHRYIPELHPETTSTGIRKSVASATLFKLGGSLECMLCLGGWFMQGVTMGFRYATLAPGFLATACRIINGYPSLLLLLSSS